MCIEGYNRNLNECAACQDGDVPKRATILIAIVLAILIAIRQCKKKLVRKLKKYRPLFDDVLRVLSINITFMQINSSIPFIIPNIWPDAWTKFMKHFSFVVDMDIMSMIGLSCISDFTYQTSFLCMVALPIVILIVSLSTYKCSVGVLAHRLATMTEDQKKKKKKQALHALFKITDVDNSGLIDPAELAGKRKELLLFSIFDLLNIFTHFFIYNKYCCFFF